MQDDRVGSGLNEANTPSLLEPERRGSTPPLSPAPEELFVLFKGTNLPYLGTPVPSTEMMLGKSLGHDVDEYLGGHTALLAQTSRGAARCSIQCSKPLVSAKRQDPCYMLGRSQGPEGHLRCGLLCAERSLEWAVWP